MKEVKTPKKPLAYYYGIVLIVLIVFNLVVTPILMKHQVKETDYGTFMSMIEKKNIGEVEVKDNQIIFTDKDQKNIYKTGLMNDPNLTDRLYECGAVFAKDIDKQMSPIISFLLTGILPLILFIALGNYMAKKLMEHAGGKNSMAFGMGKSNAKIYVQSSEGIRFSDVAGEDEAKENLSEIVDYLHNPKKYTDVGASMPKGVLLVGPPGTGKTMLAKAVAGESNVPFFSMSGSEFVEMFVGMGASKVRDLFRQAKEKAPCIVFIDEIDAIGKKRDGQMGGNDEREQTLNQLLTEMDGFEGNNGVIILAATNRPESLDPALTRPGRFDRQIFVNRPDVRGREAILKVHARNKPIDATVDFKTIARITSGFTGADLENCLNEAAILAARDNRRQITMADVNEGITKMEMGPAKKSRLVTEHDKRITAYHEAGHAILACSLKNCEPVHEVTIIPRGMAAGFTMTRPENDNEHVSKAYLLDNITMTLGGRIAEELVIEDYCTGASGDIKALTERCRKMVTEWGMSEKVGLLYYGGEQEVFVGRDYHSTQGYSEETAALIDEEVRRIVDECHERGTEILKGKLDILHNMAKVLITKETIHTDEVNMLMQGKSAAEVIDFIDVKYSTEDKKPATGTDDGRLPH